MIHIAICDDEVKICSDLERTLTDIFDRVKVECEIDVLGAGEELCRMVDAGAHYDLIFLDIEFAKSEINGVDTARFIRESHQNHLVSIVFVSWEKKYAMQLFEIHPMDFLIKPLEYEKVDKTVRTFLKIAGLWSGEFTYKKGHDIYKVQAKNILYLESSDRKLILHLNDGKKEEFYGSLKEAYNEQLHRLDFLFIHAAYAVNYDYVTVVKFNQLVLPGNAATLPISPNRRSEVRERYYEIMKRRRGS